MKDFVFKSLRAVFDFFVTKPIKGRRKPGAFSVEDAAKLDVRYSRKLPVGGVVVKVYTRILDRDGKGAFCKGTCTTLGGDKAARDHLWLTEADVKSLVPAEAKVGSKFPVPAVVAQRVARFHLMDNTRGEPPMWRKTEVRGLDLSTTVVEATGAQVKLRVEGTALLANDADLNHASRGFDVRLLGYVTYDRQRQALERFDIVAVGEHWGQGTFTGGARKGRMPLGIVFELARDESSAGLVPPQGARDLGEYLGTGK